MDTFEYWSDLGLKVQRGHDPSDAWAAVRKKTPEMLEKGNTAAIRRAYNKLLRALGARTQTVSVQSELSSIFIQYLDKHKKAWSHRVVAVFGLKALCDIENENIRGIRNNAFMVLADCLKSPGTNLTYRLSLLEALASAYTTSAEQAIVKQVWKTARSLVLDSSLALSHAAIKLMTAIIRPEFIKTPAKFEKLERLCFKAFALELPVHALLCKATFVYAECSEYSTYSTMLRIASEYPTVGLTSANGIIKYLAECYLTEIPSEQLLASSLSMITAIVQNPKMRDEYRLSVALQHIHYLVVDVIAHSLVEEKRRMALVQTIVTKLATTDRHHQLLSACLVPCLGSVLELVVLPAPLADIMYQATIALLEMSTDWHLSLRLVDFVTRFLKSAPQYFTAIGEFALGKLNTSAKLEHALLLGAVLTASNTCDDRMVELKPKIIERAMTLVKQKNHEKFSLDSYRQGWVLLQAFCSTTPQALRLFIPSYVSLFSHMLSIPNEKLQASELRYQIEIWKPTLDCVIAFGKTCLVTPDISRKIGSLLQDIWNYFGKLPEAMFSEEPLLGENREISRRVLACYSTVNFHGDLHNFPATLLTDSFAYISASQEISSHIMDHCAGGYSRDYIHEYSSVLSGTPAVPPAVDMLDQSINVVLSVFPLQLDRVKESLLDSLRAHIEASFAVPKKKSSERKERRIENVAYLFSGLCAANLKEPRLVRIVDSVLKLMIEHDALFTFEAVANFIKSHKSLGGDLAKFLVDQIISTVDQPFTRASCCNALRALIESDGLTSRNLKGIYEVLAPLSNDPHPAVHMAAIDALIACYSGSGLLDEKSAIQFTTLLSKLYVSESNSSEVDNLEYSNQEMCANNTLVRLSRGIASTVSLIGPSLQESETLFSIFYRLIDQLDGFSGLTTKYTWRCLQEAFYYATDRINWLSIISDWCKCITTTSKCPLPEYYDAAIQGILLFANRAASKLFEITGPQFQRDLWLAYDIYPSPYIKQIFSIWAEQTVTLEPQQWIERLQHVISKPRKFTDTEEEAVVNVETEEEDESLGPKAEKANNDLFNPSTRKLALDLLLSITESQLHDKSLAARQASLITHNIGDIIKIAFNASTSTVLELQISGLALLNMLIKYLHDLTDPDFPEVSLLEQYQAQISSALTPAFNADSSYELASAVIDVCANFVGSGIIKNADKFNKILKILTDPLLSDEFNVGKLKLEHLQNTALKIKISRFWAILEADRSPIAEEKEDMLGKLWINALTDYTRLEFRPEEQSYTSFFTESVDKFVRFNKKQILLPVYRESWVEMISALAVLVERHGAQIIITQDEDFMFGLVGLCFAELLKKNSKNSLNVLTSLKHILQPGVCASLVYDNEIFLEVVEVLDRIVLTGSVAEKALVIEIARNLADSQADSDESVDDLFEIFRTCVFPLKELFPFLNDPKLPISAKAEVQIPLIRLALESLIDIVQVFREVIQIDQYCCLMFIFEQIFGNATCQEKIVPHIFGSYKRLIEVMTVQYSKSPETSLLIQKSICNAFVHSTTLLKSAEDGTTVTNSMLTCMLIICTARDILLPACGNIVELGEVLARHVKGGLKVSLQSLRTILRTCKGEIYDNFVAGCVPCLMEQFVVADENENVPKDVCNLLVEYAKTSRDASTAYSIVIPALLFVLQSSWDTEERRGMYVRTLLFMLLESHPQDFKKYVGEISNEDRDAIQQLLMEPAEPEIIEETTSEITLTSFN